MNEKRKSEGELIESILSDDRSRAQKLLDKCKKTERSKKLMSVQFGTRTLYLIPIGTDIENWKRKKSKELNKQYRHNDWVHFKLSQKTSNFVRTQK